MARSHTHNLCYQQIAVLTISIVSIVTLICMLIYSNDYTPQIASYPAQRHLATTAVSILNYLSSNTPSNSNKTVQSLIPFRNDTTKQIAWNKLLNGTGKFFTIHARKAGGTMMKSWLYPKLRRLQSLHAQKGTEWHTTWENIEFWTYTNGKDAIGSTNKVDQLFTEQPYAVYAACFRDPIERIISEYDFEWRWGCQKCSAATNRVPHKVLRFDKVLDEPDIDKKRDEFKYKLSNIELDELMAEVDKYQHWSNELVLHRIAYNVYLNNYYLWMFCCNSKHCNIRKDFIETNKIDECIEHAKRAVLSMDIVVISEWVNDVRTQFYVEKLFFGNSSQIGYKTQPLSKKPNKKRQITKYGKNSMISKQLYDRLVMLNYYDLQFYAWIKQIVFERESKVWSAAYGIVHH